MSLSRKLGFIIIIIMFSAAFLGGLYAHLNNSGWFEPWKQLGKPPERAIKISFGERNLPLVETSDGIIYICSNLLSANQENCWIKADFSEFQTKVSQPCYEIALFDVPKPPGKVTDMVEFESCEVGLAATSARTTQHNFAILEDGTVWAWEYSHSIPLFAFFSIVIHTMLGAVVGVILGGAIVMVSTHRNFRKVDTA